MVALRFVLVLGLVGVAACHRAGTQVVPGSRRIDRSGVGRRGAGGAGDG